MERRGVRLKLGVQGHGGGRIYDIARQGGWGVLKFGQFSWTSYVYRPLIAMILQETSLIRRLTI